MNDKTLTSESVVVGIDVGGTKIAAGLVDHRGRITDSLRQPTRAANNREFAEQLREIVRQLVRASKFPLEGIGISVPGYIDTARGIAVSSPNTGWRDFNVREALSGEFGLAVELENDVSAAALGEKYYGLGRSLSDFVFVAIGTGIGGGLILNGRLYRGHKGRAGEVGHMLVVPGGRTCGCGLKGCVEAYASGPSIARLGKAQTAEEVFNKAARGDTAAAEVVEAAGRHLAVLCNNLNQLLDPEAIVVAGGVSKAGEMLTQAIVAGFEALEVLAEQRPRILFSERAGDIGILGSAAMFRDRLGEDRQSA